MRRVSVFPILLLLLLVPLCGQTLRVTYPNGGETLKLGVSCTATWTGSGVTGNVRLLLFRENTKVGAIASGLDVAVGRYSWTVGRLADGSTAEPGAGYRIRVVSGSGEEGVSDFSDAPFTISPAAGAAPQLRIVKPAGGKMVQGEYCSIGWESRDLRGVVRLALFKGSVKVMDISGDLPVSPGVYRWEAGRLANGDMAQTGDNYFIAIQAAAGASDLSDKPFSLTKRTGGRARNHGGVSILVHGTQFKPGERLTFAYDCPCGFPTGAAESTESIFLKRRGWERWRWIGIGNVTRDATSGSQTIDLVPGLDQADDWVISIWWGNDDCWGESAPFSIRRPAGSPILRFAHDGETLYREWDVEIDWDRTFPNWDRVKIDLLKGEAVVETLRSTGTTKKQRWRVGTSRCEDSGLPATDGGVYGSYADGGGFRIRLVDSDTGETLESGAFSIATPWISILTPNGPGRFKRGQHLRLTWRGHHLPPRITKAAITGNVYRNATDVSPTNLPSECYRTGHTPFFTLTEEAAAAEGTFSWLLPVDDYSTFWPRSDCDPFMIEIEIRCLHGSRFKARTDRLTIEHDG